MADFKDIIGQHQIKEHFLNAIKAGQPSHAYILNGETGSGRKMLADAFSKALLCEDKSSPEACGICKSCIQAESGNHPDIRILTHEKISISVDDIREQINNDIGIKPYSSEYKVYIIPDASKMTEQAQNALLKTIEEPPAYAVILLITDNINNLLPTIRSRCIILNTKPVNKEEIAAYLVKTLSMEKDQARIAAGFCQGNMGQAIRFASSENFQEMKSEVLALLKNIDSMELSEIKEVIRGFSQQKGLINDYLDLMLLWYRDVLMFKITKDANLLLYQDEYHAISKQASIRNYEDIEKIIEAIDKVKVRLDANVNFDIAIELLILTIKFG